MKIKEQTRKLAAGCSKHCFKVVDGTDEVSSKHCFMVVDGLTKSAQNTVLRLWIELTKSAQNTVLWLQIELTKSVTYTYGKATLTWFEEIFEEYKSLHNKTHITKVV
ncbi:hypothetical protein [Streptococcus pneumoniae]|uniref:hypothetical protein n=1 Tax=Streptococcus pneumoniae TaxID=1313 RepID=UPI0006C8B5AC|nr:hypothetical protein [Streptococcus pneumoniae]